MTPVSRTFDLSGFGVTVDGLDQETASELDRIWGRFAGRGDRALVHVTTKFDFPATLAATIEGPPLERSFADGGALFVSPEGKIELDANGVGRVTIGSGIASRRAFAIINLLLAGCAWRLPNEGAAMVHSGAILINGRGFVLVGSSGAGKSTFVRCAQQGGAEVVSEDLNLLITEGETVWLAGSPFRTRNYPGPGPGRWPLAAFLLSEHGGPAALQPITPLIFSAQLHANLPFVGDCWPQLPGATGVSERLEGCPARRLRFAPDPSFVPLLNEFGS